MRRLSANYIYPISSPPVKNGIIEINDTGEIVKIIDTKGILKESRNLEFYNGIIVPGFINAHCHLELSELKGQFRQHAGLPNFLKDIVEYKKLNKYANTFKAIELYDNLMRQNGIVAVGDISNYNYTIDVKKNSKLYYHTFIEIIGNGKNSQEVFESNHKLYTEYTNNGLKTSIVAHAPYSVSYDLFRLIKKFAEQEASVQSLHNQETVSEDQMFFNSSGELFEALNSLSIDLSRWQNTGKKSLESISELLPKENNIIFVHNTFSTKEDIIKANDYFSNSFWCLCPLSNLYIENTLPDINIFTQFSNSITLGTDSLASNHTLSILDEMKTIVKSFNNITINQILQWGTLNGAKALNIESKFGSLEKGKTPGLNLISNFDFKNKQLTDKSEVKALLD